MTQPPRRARTSASIVVAGALAAALLGACSDGEDRSKDGRAASASPTASTYTNPTVGGMLAVQEPGMHRVKTSTVTYRGDLQMDVYQPESDEGPSPVVLLVHGVAPGSPKDFGGFVGWGQLLATRGLATAVPNYRPTDDGNDQNATKDLRAAVAYLTEHAEDLKIDASTIAVLAFSGGGPFGIRIADDLPADRLRALALYYAPLAGFPDAAKPLPAPYRLDAFLTSHPDVPVYAVVGDKDSTPGVRDSFDEIEDQIDSYPELTMQRHPSGPHGFDFLSRDVDAQRLVATTVDFLSGELTQP